MMQILASTLAISPDEWNPQGDGPQGPVPQEVAPVLLPAQEAGLVGPAGPDLREVAEERFPAQEAGLVGPAGPDLQEAARTQDVKTEIDTEIKAKEVEECLHPATVFKGISNPQEETRICVDCGKDFKSTDLVAHATFYHSQKSCECRSGDMPGGRRPRLNQPCQVDRKWREVKVHISRTHLFCSKFELANGASLSIIFVSGECK